MVMSSAVRRLATLTLPSYSQTSEWVPHICSLPDRQHLAELRKLIVSTDVCAQSGSEHGSLLELWIPWILQQI